MTYVVFKVPKEKSSAISQVCGDDVVSRQSITTRDGVALSLDPSYVYVLIEGSEVSMDRARELFKSLDCSEEKHDAQKVYALIKEEEDSAAAGMGAVFDLG